MQNGSYSLIDQIITNSNTNVVHSGSIIDEISDHFITFLQPNLTRTKQKPKENKRRLINEQTIQNFKNDLANMDWRSVLTEINVNASYDKFWEIYNNLYETHFPWVTHKFNKNLHKICNFMTPGLLQSRRTKLELRKKSLTDPSPLNLTNYKNFRNTTKLYELVKNRTLSKKYSRTKKILKRPGTF
jgi:hypothetical protein